MGPIASKIAPKMKISLCWQFFLLLCGRYYAAIASHKKEGGEEISM